MKMEEGKKQQTDPFIGGMYNILNLIRSILIEIDKEDITVKEIAEVLPLSERAISRSMNNLVKLNIMEKIETRDKECYNCKRTKYRIRESVKNESS